MKILWIIFLLIVVGCGSRTYNPPHIDVVSKKANLEFKNTEFRKKGNIVLTVAVLDDEESEMVFGVPAVSKGVEPVWLKIENNDNKPYVLFPIEIDHFYFSPREAARKIDIPNDKETSKRIEKDLINHSIKKMIHPGETVSGFVYTVPEKGIKEFRVHLVGPGSEVSTYFVFAVPGINIDIDDLSIDQHFYSVGIVDGDGSLLFEKLSEMPCCTSNKEGDKYGDPLNLIIIGHLEDFLPYFIHRGWDVTEDIYLSSIYREIMAFFFGSSYRYAPVSALYFEGREQDLAMQKPRSNIYARNHFRLWLTEMSYKGEPIWIGQISRDIGISFTTKHWWLSTHDIDPDVDEARNFFVQDMLSSHGVQKVGYVRGMEPKPDHDPLENFMQQPIFTDGLRAVLIFSAEQTPITEVDLFHWEWPEEYKLDGVVKWENKPESEVIEVNDSPIR